MTTAQQVSQWEQLVSWPGKGKKPISPAEFEQYVKEVLGDTEGHLPVGMEDVLLDTLDSIGYGAGIELIRGASRDSGERK